MSRRKTAGFPGEKKIWKSRRILQRRARELLKARVYLREKEGVSTARRYRRHGGIEGQKEFSAAKKRSRKRRGDVEGIDQISRTKKKSFRDREKISTTKRRFRWRG